jgi:hypothetical protein
MLTNLSALMYLEFRKTLPCASFQSMNHEHNLSPVFSYQSIFKCAHMNIKCLCQVLLQHHGCDILAKILEILVYIQYRF